MPMFDSTHDLFLTLYASGHLNRLKAALGECETTSRDSPFDEGFNFNACQHPGTGTCTTCLSGRVEFHPRPGTLTVVVRRIPADRWTTALRAIGPAHQPATPTAPDPFSLGPFDSVPGWEKVTSFVPDTTAAQLTTSPTYKAHTYLKDHADPGHLLAILTITPVAREHCAPAWDQGVRFLNTLTSSGTRDTATTQSPTADVR